MKEFIHNIKIKLGWIGCPACNAFIKPKWVKDWIYDPEEPPMFYYYKCPKCGARTDTEPSLLTEKACKSLGFDNFSDYADKFMK
jgi:uncharacterized protein (UPF0212 family)